MISRIYGLYKAKIRRKRNQSKSEVIYLIVMGNLFSTDLKIDIKFDLTTANPKTFNKLVGYGVDPFYKNDDYFILRRKKTFDWETQNRVPTERSLTNLNNDVC